MQIVEICCVSTLLEILIGIFGAYTRGEFGVSTLLEILTEVRTTFSYAFRFFTFQPFLRF